MAIRNQPGEKLTTKSLISLTPESRVAARLGLTRVLCASLSRDHLKPQVDYVVERKRVMITDAGYVALRGLLSCLSRPTKKKPVCVTACASLSRFAGDFLAPARRGTKRSSRLRGLARILRVRVKDNANFLPGMEIRARAS